MPKTTTAGSALAAPGKHEARALTSRCSQCGTGQQPASVLDDARRGRTLRRLASYRCAACDARWLRAWPSVRASGALRAARQRYEEKALREGGR